jgi:hypothetical protein
VVVLVVAVALLFAATSAILAAGFPSPAAAATAGWSSGTLIDPGGGYRLTSVSCPRASFCAAVDRDGNVLTYNGSSWSSPVDIDAGNYLSSISCPTASFCAAVDESGNVLTYNGSSWSSPADIDGSNALESISCSSAIFCAAVDKSGNVLSYDGSSWSSDDIDGTTTLLSVSCPTAIFCAAVDWNGNVLTYNGSSWSSPADDIDGSNALFSVSCPTAIFCAAVDDSGNVLTYNGSSWSSPADDIDGSHALNSVSCPTASFCAAVDATGQILTYNGSSWSSPDDIAATNWLYSVSCPTASFCVAVDSTDAFTYSPSTTTITSITSNPVVGQPVSVGVQVTGPSTTSGSLTPSGQVTVSDGARSCEATLSGSNGTATASCSITEQAAGNYSLTASYPGDANFASSETSTSTSLTVAKGTSKTALKLSARKVTYGHEQTEHLSVTVSPQYSGSTPTGTVTVTESTTTLCTFTLSSAKGSCTLSATEFGPGTYGLVATYGGSADFDGSASVEESFTVAKETTKTTLKLWATKVTYRDEQAEHLSVIVSPQYSGSTPTGTVTVTQSTTTLCTFALSGARGSCTLSATEFGPGTYGLVATYGGSADFDGSASVEDSLTVAKETTKTTLKLSATTVTYSDEGAAHLSVTVSPEFAGSTPTGTVTVTQSTATLCVITLSSAKGSCTLSATEFGPGTYHLVATYGGSTNFGGSASAQESLTVVKATWKTTLRLSVAKVTYGDEQTEHLSVTVSPQHSGSKPTGKVTVKESTATLCVITLKSAKGSCKLSAKRLKVGTYHLVATYGGSSNFKRSTSAKKKLTVVK